MGYADQSPARRRRQGKKRRAEEARWAARSSEVVVRHVESGAMNPADESGGAGEGEVPQALTRPARPPLRTVSREELQQARSRTNRR